MTLRVPQHDVPAPTTVSPHAQAFLSQRLEPTGPAQPVGTADKDAWRAYIEGSNKWLTAGLLASAESFPAEIITHQLPNTALYEVIPDDPAPDTAILYLHGGAYIHGAGMAGAYMAIPLAGHAEIRAFAVDYRMPPDHPFPAGLDDAVDAYRWLLERYEPTRIAFAGGSAGGGLAAAAALKVRDLGLPLPAACVLATPEADLTESGDSFETLIHVDVVGGARLTDSINLYADGHDLRDPYLSPLFGDFRKGYPPTLLTGGTRDLFLSNTVLLHRALRRAGIEAQLDLWEAMPHGGFFGAPEDHEVLEVQARFLTTRLSGEPR
ncbi:alpha/beta hydrolase fold domain-containing protein [Streptomyces mirabilis]|uniref:alpha/beta hydrolase fold domain-containing protein n=1 Tax=Streptomyces mirabilis TaxID=68239 RepID=UPI0036EA54B2